MTLPALYQLVGQYRQLAERLSEGDFDAETIRDTIESTGITDDIAVKAQGIEMVARNLEQYTPAIDAEIERLQALKKQRQAKAAALRRYMLDGMLTMGVDKIETPFFKLCVRDNPPAVEVYDALSVPNHFMRVPDPQPPAIDKKAIAAAIKDGAEVPGCRLVRGQRLEVR